MLDEVVYKISDLTTILSGRSRVPGGWWWWWWWEVCKVIIVSNQTRLSRGVQKKQNFWIWISWQHFPIRIGHMRYHKKFKLSRWSETIPTGTSIWGLKNGRKSLKLLTRFCFSYNFWSDAYFSIQFSLVIYVNPAIRIETHMDHIRGHIKSGHYGQIVENSQNCPK